MMVGDMGDVGVFLLILTPRLRYSYSCSVTEKPDVMVLAGPKGQKPARRAESGPKGRQLEVGPVGPIDF